jgi:hypothetical protein
LTAAFGIDTPKTILEHMLLEEQKYEKLTIQYRKEYYSPESKQISEATYSHDLSRGLRLRQSRTRIIDPNDPAKEHEENMSVSFNGQSTFAFTGPSVYKKEKEGFVLKGFNKSYFSALYANPYSMTWCVGGGIKKWTQVIEQNIADFKIESTSEFIEGLPVIEMAGYTDNGRTKCVLWICPERNYLPLKQQIWDAKESRLIQEVGLYELKQLPNGIWFPMLIKFPAEPPAIPDAKVKITQSVLTISIEPNKDFSLDFPPDTYVIDEVNEVSYRITALQKGEK